MEACLEKMISKQDLIYKHACMYIKLRGRFKKNKGHKKVCAWLEKKSKNLQRACIFIKQVRGGGFLLSLFCNMYSDFPCNLFLDLDFLDLDAHLTTKVI